MDQQLSDREDQAPNSSGIGSSSSAYVRRYIHLKEISVYFIKRRPTSILELVFKDDAGVKKSNRFRVKQGDLVYWNFDMYIEADTSATLLVRRAPFKISVAEIEIKFEPSKFVDDRAVALEDRKHRVGVNFVCRRSQYLPRHFHFHGFQAHTDLALKFPPLAALQPLSPTFERTYNVPYHANDRLNDDILLDIFNCDRLDNEYNWNYQRWRDLSHVCQRWRHLIYKFAFHLRLQLFCTHGTPILDMLDHSPSLPLYVYYGYSGRSMTVRDEMGLYHALQLHDRVLEISLRLPPSMLHKCFALMDKHFPILERLHLSAESTADDITTFTLPKAFLAPNLRLLELPGVSPPRILRVLTSTVSLVTLELTDIQTSSYFRPRLLVARLSSLPQLERLSIGFSVPIPRPSTEGGLLGKLGTPVTLPNLTFLKFKGVTAYLERLVAQIRAPLLVGLEIRLFNQIAFALPHLSYLINTTEVFKPTGATKIIFGRDTVSVTPYHDKSRPYGGSFHLSVRCKQLDWQIDCEVQICSRLIPWLSGVERLVLTIYVDNMTLPAEWQNGEINGTTWQELLRLFVGVKELYIEYALLQELSRALLVDGVGSDLGFLPELQEIYAKENLFTSFIYKRRFLGRPVQFRRRVFDLDLIETSTPTETEYTW
ncbi:hypothetical protein EI94DRAFT_1724039 [Lactarius quietus]|nr:hypothetical protein EI94DRAFT_1724039 [Lactarius quietus]